MLNVVEDTLKDDKKRIKGDGEEIVSCIFYLDDNRCIVTFACYKKLMVRVNIDQKICITFS